MIGRRDPYLHNDHYTRLEPPLYSTWRHRGTRPSRRSRWHSSKKNRGGSRPLRARSPSPRYGYGFPRKPMGLNDFIVPRIDYDVTESDIKRYFRLYNIGITTVLINERTHDESRYCFFSVKSPEDFEKAEALGKITIKHGSYQFRRCGERRTLQQRETLAKTRSSELIHKAQELGIDLKTILGSRSLPVTASPQMKCSLHHEVNDNPAKYNIRRSHRVDPLTNRRREPLTWSGIAAPVIEGVGSTLPLVHVEDVSEYYDTPGVGFGDNFVAKYDDSTRKLQEMGINVRAEVTPHYSGNALLRQLEMERQKRAHDTKIPKTVILGGAPSRYQNKAATSSDRDHSNIGPGKDHHQSTEPVRDYHQSTKPGREVIKLPPKETLQETLRSHEYRYEYRPRTVKLSNKDYVECENPLFPFDIPDYFQFLRPEKLAQYSPNIPSIQVEQDLLMFDDEVLPCEKEVPVVYDLIDLSTTDNTGSFDVSTDYNGLELSSQPSSSTGLLHACGTGLSYDSSTRLSHDSNKGLSHDTSALVSAHGSSFKSFTSDSLRCDRRSGSLSPESTSLLLFFKSELEQMLIKEEYKDLSSTMHQLLQIYTNNNIDEEHRRAGADDILSEIVSLTERSEEVAQLIDDLDDDEMIEEIRDTTLRDIDNDLDQLNCKLLLLEIGNSLE